MPAPQSAPLLPRPHVVHVARECSGIAAAGGVGDVVLQLARECALQGLRTTVVLPHYGALRRRRLLRRVERAAAGLPGAAPKPRMPAAVDCRIPMAYEDEPQRCERVRLAPVEFGDASGLTFVFALAKRFAGKSRPYTYTAAEARAIAAADPDASSVCGAEPPPKWAGIEEGSGHFDYFAMNILLLKAALAWLERLRDPPDAVHCHDAHAAALPMLAKLSAPPSPAAGARFVVTAHNCGAAYRQRCADLGFAAAVCGLESEAVRRCVIDGEFDPLASAALHADALTTVSDGYRWEVQGAWMETSGGDPDLRGLSAFLARNRIPLHGIVNGVAAELKGPEALAKPPGEGEGRFAWKSAFRAGFARRASAARLPRRWGLRAANRLGGLGNLPEDGCLFTFIGRWTPQKGVDILARAAEEVLDLHPDAGLCILGDGSQPLLAERLAALAERFPGRACVLKGFSPRLAADLYAAGDFCVVPSRFEPCGLVDLIAQLNGSLPVVNLVGGLSKVVDGVSGLGYFGVSDRENLRGLVRAMRRAIALRRDASRLAAMRRTADERARRRHSWGSAFRRYAQLYGLRPASGPAAWKRQGSEAP